MTAHKHSWKYSQGVEHRVCECGAEQTLQAQQDTCGLRHWGPTSESQRNRTKASNGPGRFNFIGNSMIPAGEYVAAKYYDEAMDAVAAMRADIDRLLAVLATIDLVLEYNVRKQNASGRGLPPSSDGA
ncbi:MAG: hypothetical protein IT480_02420 [Gammaproteobacteria bacterium]|nr:hypothetical protein [Gammaproteobacteria bacterium]